MHSEPHGPSPEQQEVIESRSTNLVIPASAGVGKTYVLVERYLRLVREGIKPDHILAITFTRKAAGEMKSRIVRRLREANLREQARIAETGPIQTIHGFCERLLRENAVEAGLDPEFEVLEDSQALISRCAREALAASPEEVPQLKDILQHLAKKMNQDRAEADLQDWVTGAIDRLRGAGRSRNAFATHSCSTEALRIQWEKALVQGMEAQWQEEFSQTPGEFVERLETVSRNRKRRPPGVNVAKFLESIESFPALAGFGQLVVKAWELFDERLAEQSALDFGGLELRAVQIAESGRLRDMPYQVMLVDEAQDVNPLQYRLLNALKAREQLLVGDIKQSIYGFRHAAPHLFDERKATATVLTLSTNRRSEEQGVLRFVDEVFKREMSEYTAMAQPRILDLADDPRQDFTGVEAWELTKTDWPEEVASYTQELVCEGHATGDIAVLVRTRDQGQRVKDALERKGMPSVILGGAERYYARLEIRDLSNTLRALTDTSDTFALLSALRSPIAGLSLDSIVLLAKEDDIMATLSANCGPVEEDRPKIARFMEWFVPLSQCADRMSAGEVLGFILADSPLMEELAKRRDSSQRIANARKLLRLASTEPETSPRDFAERVRGIQSLRHRESDAPAHEDENECIKIMTIHKAKGLEFPITIVPSTSEQLGEVKKGGLLHEVDWDLFCFPYLGKAYMEWMRSHQQKREHDDAMRLLYVALTRSKRRLCVGLYPKDSLKCSSALMRKVLESPNVSGVVWRPDGT